MANSLPNFSPSTRLGQNIGKGRYRWHSLQSILLAECVKDPRDTSCKVPDTVLDDTKATINADIPASIQALNGDTIARSFQKSTDAYTWIVLGNHFLLVECKFKVCPVASIMYNKAKFKETIGDKFSASRKFLTDNNCHCSPDCVVLFNNASVESVKNMFTKLKLANPNCSHLKQFKIFGISELAKNL